MGTTCNEEPEKKENVVQTASNWNLQRLLKTELYFMRYCNLKFGTIEPVKNLHLFKTTLVQKTHLGKQKHTKN